MRVALVFGVQGEKVKPRLEKVMDNLTLDCYKSLPLFLNGTIKRQITYDRVVILTKVIASGKELTDLYKFWSQESKATSLVFICKNGEENARATKILTKFSSLNVGCMLLESTTMAELTKSLKVSPKKLNEEFGLTQFLDMASMGDDDDDALVYDGERPELESPEPEEESQEQLQPKGKKKKGLLTSVFGKKSKGTVPPVNESNSPETEYEEDGYYAEDGYAEDGYVEDGYAEDGYAEDGYAEDGYAEDGYVEDGYAEDGYTDEGYVDEGYAEDGYTDEGYTDEGYSDEFAEADYTDEGYSEEYADEGYTETYPDEYTEEGFDQEATSDFAMNSTPYDDEGNYDDGYGEDNLSDMIETNYPSEDFEGGSPEDYPDEFGEYTANSDEESTVDYAEDDQYEDTPAEDSEEYVDEFAEYGEETEEYTDEFESNDISEDAEFTEELPAEPIRPVKQKVAPEVEEVGDVDIPVMDDVYVPSNKMTENFHIEVEEVADMGDAMNLANVESNYQETVNKPKVVTKVVEKEVVRTVGGNSVVQNIISGKAHRTIIFTGDRGTGVTAAAYTLAKEFAKKVPVLYFDVDTTRHGLLSYIDYGAFMNYDEVQREGIKRCQTGASLTHCVCMFDTNFDMLTTDYSCDTTDEEIEMCQSAVAEHEADYGLVVVDCPLEKLHLMLDLLSSSSLVVCMEGTHRGVMNMVCSLEGSEVGSRYKRNIASRGTIFMTKLRGKDNPKKIIEFGNTIYEPSNGINYLGMPVIPFTGKYSKDILGQILEV